MIPEETWCREVAEVLGLAEPGGLREVLIFAGHDRCLAWRFALSLAKIGMCPVEVARATLAAAGWPQGHDFAACPIIVPPAPQA